MRSEARPCARDTSHPVFVLGHASTVGRYDHHALAPEARPTDDSIGERPGEGDGWNYREVTLKRNLDVTAPSATLNLGGWTRYDGDDEPNPFSRD